MQTRELRTERKRAAAPTQASRQPHLSNYGHPASPEKLPSLPHRVAQHQLGSAWTEMQKTAFFQSGNLSSTPLCSSHVLILWP